MKKKYRDYSYTAKREHKNRVISIIFLIFFIFITYNLITIYLIKPYRICSNAMDPELSNNQLILSSPIYNAKKSAKRGQLVLVSRETESLSFAKRAVNSLFRFCTLQLYEPFGAKGAPATKFSIRRIVALPGDTIYMKDFILHIKTPDNNHFLSEFELAKVNYDVKLDNLPKNWNAKQAFSGSYPEITLKEDEYFLLCDNRIISDDSRFWGVIPESGIIGKVLMLYWPFNKFKTYE